MTGPHSIISREPASERYSSHCNVAGCARGSGRFVFVCGDHWLLIAPATRAELIDEWERYVAARRRTGQEEACRGALVRFYSIARHEALPQIRANLAAGPLVLAEAHP